MMRKCLFLQVVLVLFLSCIAWVRTEFSIDRISAPLDEIQEENPSLEVMQALNQPYYFLDRGRQAFVFESKDRQFVIKFFDRKYMQIPWYTGWFVDRQNETVKRDQRRFFYWNSYRLARSLLQKETALLCVHQGKLDGLPCVSLVDKASRTFQIDLNRTPFILQRKGASFYDFLDQRSKKEGNGALMMALQEFLQLIEHRISLNVSDADHDVRHNFGSLDQKVIHLDPGRLTLQDLSNPELRKYEWWKATHNLRKWLVREHPDVVAEFDHWVQKKSEGDV